MAYGAHGAPGLLAVGERRTLIFSPLSPFCFGEKKCAFRAVDYEQTLRQTALVPRAFDAVQVASSELGRKRRAAAPARRPHGAAQEISRANRRKKNSSSRNSTSHFLHSSPPPSTPKPPARASFPAPNTHLCKSPRGPAVSAPGGGLLQHRRDASPIAAVLRERLEENLVFHRRPRCARARVRARAGLTGAQGPELGLRSGDERLHGALVHGSRGGRVGDVWKQVFFLESSVARKSDSLLDSSRHRN